MNNKDLVGSLVVAHPNNPKDHLQHAVIIVVKNTEEISLGLQINRPILTTDLSTICEQLELFVDRDDSIFFGGKLQSNKIHVIHSLDWTGITTVKLNQHVGLTNDLSVLAAIAQEQGPEHFRACAGFWGWDGGDLEQQIQGSLKSSKYRWAQVPASLELLFNSGVELEQWNAVIKSHVGNKINDYF